MVLPTVIRLVTLGFFLLLFFIIFARIRTYREKPIFLILFLTGIGVINIIVEVLLGTPKIYSLFQFFQYLMVYGVFRLIFVYSFLFYFEFHQYERPRLVSIMVALISIVPSAVTLSFALTLLSNGVDFPSEIWTYLPFVAIPLGFGLLYAVVTILIDGFKFIKTAANQAQKKQLIFLLIGIVFWFLLPNLFLSLASMNLTSNPGVTAFAFNTALPGLMMIGIFFTTFSFTISNQVMVPGIRLVDNIIVINSGGVPEYSYKFEDLKTQEALLSGGISAINSLLKESIGITSNVKKIDFEEKEVMIFSLEDLGFILVTDHATSYLEYALKKFAEEYVENIDTTFDGKLDDEEEITTILVNSFGLFDGIEYLS